MKIEEKYQNAVLTHRYGGTDWVVVQNLSTKYCRVVSAGKQGVGRRAFVAHKDVLTQQVQRIPDGDGWKSEDLKLTAEAQADLDDLRRQIDKGTLVVKASHILAA